MMKRIIILFLIAANFTLLFGQTVLVNEGATVNNTVTGDWGGVNIPRSVPTRLTYRNNSITSVNSSGYMLQAGDESPLSTNNKLDGEVITGNKFSWKGATSSSIITHGLFAGYNINSVVKYNYLENVPYGIIFKSGTDAGVNMTFTSGGCAYNIWKNGKFAGRVKGINGVKFYNNTFYSGDANGWYLLLISTNMDRVVPAGSKDTKVFNNIFYSAKQIPMIEIYDNASLTGFQSDYNVFYCEAGEPIFNIAGVKKTWSQWRALGYDTHSVIKNPDFINTTDLVPRVRLDYGTNLGTEWQTGLSTNATWVAGSSPATSDQNGTWQAGARIYASGTTVSPAYIGSVVENATPTLLIMTYNLSLANVTPAATSFSVLVNSVARLVNTVTVSGTLIQLTLASRIVSGDIVTVSYTKPASNPIQTTSGGIAASIGSQQVINNCINVPPTAVITAPVVNSSYTAPANILITADASDNDGNVSMVDFYSGSTKLGSKSVAPYTFTWSNVVAGNYSLTVITTDNLNAKTTSSAISVAVINSNPVQNEHPVVRIFNPHKGNNYENLSSVTIGAIASDPDGTISKVEFYNGSVKLVEFTSEPYTYTWKDVVAGNYSITAIATDNLNDTTISSPVELVVGTKAKYDANSDIIKLYPNPNNGQLSIEFINPLQNDKSEIIITDLAGKQVYSGLVLKEELLKQIDLSNSKSGIYVMMIKDKHILVTKKFIKN